MSLQSPSVNTALRNEILTILQQYQLAYQKQYNTANDDITKAIYNFKLFALPQYNPTQMKEYIIETFAPSLWQITFHHPNLYENKSLMKIIKSTAELWDKNGSSKHDQPCQLHNNAANKIKVLTQQRDTNEPSNADLLPSLPSISIDSHKYLLNTKNISFCGFSFDNSLNTFLNLFQNHLNISEPMLNNKDHTAMSEPQTPHEPPKRLSNLGKKFN
ncbi:MAG: hypothetical protein JSS07_06250 [Proteobacteria bacterium]|nr:hypothetical protein [Pseudomonadota bacterium]